MATPGAAVTPRNTPVCKARRGLGAGSGVTFAAGAAPASPMPPSISSARACTARAASGPLADRVMASPCRIARAMTPTGLFALERRLKAATVTSASNPLARAAMRAAGRAWMPWASGVTTLRSASTPAASTTGPVPPDARSVISGSPAWTSRSVTRFATSKASPLVMMMGVIRLFACPPIRSRSNSISGSPAFTACPSMTRAVKPSPFRATVSSPMCISTSTPLSPRSVTAWSAGARIVTTPSQGARNTPSMGSTATPSPIIRSAKTGSGASESGAAQPAMGATRTMSVMGAPGCRG